VTRSLQVEPLVPLLAEEAGFRETFYKTQFKCSSDGVLRGVMVGWWDDLEQTSTLLRKHGANKKEAAAFLSVWRCVVSGQAPRSPPQHVLNCTRLPLALALALAIP